jgi:hypothetical protein
MVVKDLIEMLAKIDPKAQVNLMIHNEDGEVGNKIIDDHNVFGYWDHEDGDENSHGVYVISNREIDDGAS